MPGLFLSRCFFGRKPTTCHVWGRLTIPETEMTWGASWRETNMPSEQPAPSTGPVWARRQVIQHPGFKPPWYQEEQRNAIHTGSWPKRRFMAKTMLLFWKKKNTQSLITGIIFLQHHSHTPSCIYHTTVLTILFDQDGFVSSTRSERSYLQISRTKRP